MTNKIIVFIFLIIFFNSGLAQNELREKKLSLNDCLQTGLENNKSLKSSSFRVANALAKYNEAKTAQLPQLKFSGGYSRLSDVPEFSIALPITGMKPITVFPTILNNYNLKLGLQQPLFTGFKISSSIDMAENNYLSASEDFTKDKSEILYDIKFAYWNLQKAKWMKKLIEENIKMVESHLNDIRNSYDKGMSSKNDVLSVEVQLSNTKVIMIETENLIKIGKANLCNQIGINILSDIEIIESPVDNIPELSSFENYIEKAVKTRPELKSMQFKYKMAEASVTMAKSNWFPQVFLSANYAYANPNQRYMPPVAEFKDSWDVGIGISFDIWNWGANSSKIEQAQSQQSEVNTGLDQLKDNITFDVYQSYLNIFQLREKLEYMKKSVEKGEENYRVSKEKFSKGLLSNSEFLDAEVSLLQVKTNLTSCLIDLQIAYAKLEKAIGN